MYVFYCGALLFCPILSTTLHRPWETSIYSTREWSQSFSGILKVHNYVWMDGSSYPLDTLYVYVYMYNSLGFMYVWLPT